MEYREGRPRIELQATMLMLPPKQLRPNASRQVPTGMKIRLRTELKEAAWVAIVDARNRWEETNHRRWVVLQQAKLRYTFVFKELRQRDDDNYLSGMKLVQDQLVRAGIIANDDNTCLTLLKPAMLISDKAPQVIITIMEE